MKKSKLKGFTLVELIIVMAIFGIIMLATMQLVDPVSKVMTKANVREANSSAVDNMKRYLEGNLRYANAIEAHMGALTDFDGTALADDTEANKMVSMKKAVLNFAQQYYINKTDNNDKPFEGIIRVMEIDNKNGGRINEYEYKFKAGYVQWVPDEDSTSPTYKEFVKKEIVPAEIVQSTLSDGSKADCIKNLDVINPVYYEDYSFYIAPGYNELVKVSHTPGDEDHYCATIQPITKTNPDGSTYTSDTFSPDLFSMSIVTYKKGGSYPLKDDPATPENEADDPATTENEARVFESPVAVSNTTMSLVNINSEFAKISNLRNYYGPVRYEGTGKFQGVLQAKKATDKIDLNDDTNWDYDTSATLLLTSSFSQDHSVWYIYNTNAAVSDNMYFIYTLPEAK